MEAPEDRCLGLVTPRLAVFERIYVRYPRSDQLFEKIDYCRVHSKIAKDPDCLLITGEQGAGKTSLAERYEKVSPKDGDKNC